MFIHCNGTGAGYKRKYKVLLVLTLREVPFSCLVFCEDDGTPSYNSMNLGTTLQIRSINISVSLIIKLSYTY